MWDIPNTMLSAVKTAAPQIKALTFVHSPCDEQIRAACRERDIIIVWADPPDFVRYLDEN